MTPTSFSCIAVYLSLRECLHEPIAPSLMYRRITARGHRAALTRYFPGYWPNITGRRKASGGVVYSITACPRAFHKLQQHTLSTKMMVYHKDTHNTIVYSSWYATHVHNMGVDHVGLRLLQSLINTRVGRKAFVLSEER